jgi:hypothetical protein
MSRVSDLKSLTSKTSYCISHTRSNYATLFVHFMCNTFCTPTETKVRITRKNRFTLIQKSRPLPILHTCVSFSLISYYIFHLKSPKSAVVGIELQSEYHLEGKRKTYVSFLLSASWRSARDWTKLLISNCCLKVVWYCFQIHTIITSLKRSDRSQKKLNWNFTFCNKVTWFSFSNFYTAENRTRQPRFWRQLLKPSTRALSGHSN